MTEERKDAPSQKRLLTTYHELSRTLGRRKWCYTNPDAKVVNEENFKIGEHGVSYAIWNKCKSYYGKVVLQAYVEFYERKTLRELPRCYPGFWNEALYDSETNQVYCQNFLHDGEVDSGPWTTGELVCETDIDTRLVALQFSESDQELDVKINWEEEIEDTASLLGSLYKRLKTVNCSIHT